MAFAFTIEFKNSVKLIAGGCVMFQLGSTSSGCWALTGLLLAFCSNPAVAAEASPAGTSTAHYDPMQLDANRASEVIDTSVHDRTRDREIPLRLYLPSGKSPAPVILLSHGLGGSRRACGYAGEHWSARGYVVVAMQHHGSDESVWKDQPIRERMNALKRAASVRPALDRYADVKFVLDELASFNETDERLKGRLNLEKVGMSGHSFGAATTQGVSGQSAPGIGQRFTDKRIDAAVMFSPNRPRRFDPKAAFEKVSIPWMLMTGTKDTSPVNDTTPEDRRQVYPALPNTIDKYELVLHDAEHSAFGDGRGKSDSRHPNHHRAILALTTAFWDSYLNEDLEAKAWLGSDSARDVLESKDLWQKNLKAESVGKSLR
ncbi:dienelactone hydrolase [Stieleria sp. JC731]|uniref:alpha/beta hydrolase family protein n=1 Tax=Pirellulaceae TaxID=2691357 RepID=UPI001E55119F|nr:dienelactone hydrolase [Stieleria sp. JC731]MCC9600264.1 dienelactone hydrolase [Stieleria sp. JC731]